jgi:hypothetical protein
MTGAQTVEISQEQFDKLGAIIDRKHRFAYRMADLLRRLGAWDIHDAGGHTGRYACAWCDADSTDVDNVKHLHDCSLAVLLAEWDAAGSPT